MAEKEETKTYILELGGDKQRKITIPASWKVTFGPTAPGQRGQSVWSLRLYETKDKQRAIFTDVVSFRDETIPILEKRTKVKRQTLQRASGKGEKAVVAEARFEEWIDPDNPESEEIPDDYLSLTHDASEDEEGGF